MVLSRFTVKLGESWCYIDLQNFFEKQYVRNMVLSDLQLKAKLCIADVWPPQANLGVAVSAASVMI